MGWRIQKIAIQAYQLPFRQPFVTAMGTYSDRQGYLVRVWSQTGAIGVGEAAPLAGWGMESLIQTAGAMAKMQTSLVGASLNSVAEILALLAEYADTPAARHGMELALLDLLGRCENLALAKLLNPQARSQVRVNAVLGSGSMVQAIAQAKEFKQLGYSCIKLKVGSSSWQQDLARIETIRNLVGQNVALRLDANQAWQEDQAIANLAELESLNIEYIEQPLAAKNLAGMARLKQLAKVAIAADEAVQNLAQLDLVIAHQAADLVILKPMALGGILTAKLAAEKAEAAGLGVVITTTLDGAIARLGALHLAATLPQLSFACGLATGYLLGQDFYLDQVQGGRLILPGATGIGIELAGVLWKQ